MSHSPYVQDQRAPPISVLKLPKQKQKDEGVMGGGCKFVTGSAFGLKVSRPQYTSRDTVLEIETNTPGSSEAHVFSNCNTKSVRNG